MGLGPGYGPLPTWSGAPSRSPVPPDPFWKVGHCPETTPASAGKCDSHSECLRFYAQAFGFSERSVVTLLRDHSGASLGTSLSVESMAFAKQKYKQSVKHMGRITLEMLLICC